MSENLKELEKLLRIKIGLMHSIDGVKLPNIEFQKIGETPYIFLIRLKLK